MASSKLQTIELKGHKGAVLCLDHNSSSSGGSGPIAGCLLSGSEDGTARLWDLRSSPRAGTCIVAGEEVTSVAFGPRESESTEESEFSRNYSVYLSFGGVVNAYDLRQARTPVIREVSESLIQAEDDVNQIVISDKRKDGSLYLASGDDAGVVQVVPINKRSKGGFKKTILEHGQDALVTSCNFRPCSKNLELASGGTDCRVCLWDVNKPKRPLCAKIVTTNQTGAQVCNPPMVHSLAWSPSGQLLAAGLGDGTSSVFSIENRSLVEVARLQDLNEGDCPVASVVFPSFVPSKCIKEHPTSQDRLLAVIRNDAVINMWDLGCTVAGEKAINPTETKLRSIHVDGDQKLMKPDLVEDQMEDLSLLADQPSLLFKIQHPNHKKPNWILSSCGNDDHFPSSLFVADTSPVITAYTLPL